MSYNFEPLLSVIVPIYNTEDYLERCLNSIINQSYKNLEIILVNDGSTDGSKFLCDDFKKKDSRIKVIHKENGGQSSARNLGLEQVTGEFVTFVDSDDWIDTTIYEKCLEVLKKENCDVVDFRPIYTTGETYKNNADCHYSTISGTENILYDYLYRGQTDLCPFSVCRKVYKKNLFENIRFPNGKINEDIITNFMILEECDKLTHIDYIGYYYYQDHKQSTTSGMLIRKDFDLLDICNDLCNLSKKYDDNRIQYLSEVKMARSYFSLLAKASVEGKGKDIDENDLNYLIKQLRHNYFLLMNSPIPLNRKIIISVMCINYKIVSYIYSFVSLMKEVF